uniref:Uncharacterized protein n=1 Tax=Rhizophora mucronata TaxID=61149 RepID=A0A2P2LC03_RHIMU
MYANCPRIIWTAGCIHREASIIYTKLQ